MNPAAGEKGPLDRVLDSAVYAPLGFLLSRGKTIDELAAAGRKQVAFSRSLGRAAIQGLARSAGSGAAPTAETPETKLHARVPASVSASPSKDDDEGAVEGYDELTARQIVSLLGRCSSQQVHWIHARESMGKMRVTVLRAAERVMLA